MIIATALTELAEKKEKARNEVKKGNENKESKESNKSKEGAESKESDQNSSTPHLETVICGRNRLENGSMQAWAGAFAANTKVRTVRLPQNGIRPAGLATLIGDGLAKTEELHLLDLQDNTMTSEGARALAASLPAWRQLKELGVGDCLLGPRGSEWVVKALARGDNRALEVLRLQYNEMRAKGVKDLADAMDRIPRLRRVELNGNQFDEEDEGAEELRLSLGKRKEAGIDGVQEKGENDWGLDDLDDLEEPDEDEEDDDEGADSEAESEEDIKKDDINMTDKIKKDLKTTDEAENENVAEEQDKKVDELADQLGKTGL